MANNQSWSNPGSRQSPGVALSAVYRAVSGTPPSDGSPLITGIINSGAGTLTISGSGFGVKDRPSQIFADYVDKAYEFGVENAYHSTFSEMQGLMDAVQDASALYAAIKTDQRPVITRARSKRHAGHTASYLLRGQQSYCGKPVCHGGTGGYSTPPNKPRTYQATWYRVKYAPTGLWAIYVPDSGFSGGAPIPGEPISFVSSKGTVYHGTYIGRGGSNPDKREISFDRPHPSTNDPKGKVINFHTSGASCVFPSHASAIDGYVLPGTKFTRIWDGPAGGDFIQITVTSNDMYGTSSRFGILPKKYDSPPLVPEQWHLSEVLIDLEAGYLEHRLDGESRGLWKFSPIIPYVNETSFFIGFWGFDGSKGENNEMEIESRYGDDTLQRVVISTSPTAALMSRANGHSFEIQRLQSWSDSQITVARNNGALDMSNPLYMYVYNETGTCNAEGYPL